MPIKRRTILSSSLNNFALNNLLSGHFGPYHKPSWEFHGISKPWKPPGNCCGNRPHFGASLAQLVWQLCGSASSRGLLVHPLVTPTDSKLVNHGESVHISSQSFTFFEFTFHISPSTFTIYIYLHLLIHLLVLSTPFVPDSQAPTTGDLPNFSLQEALLGPNEFLGRYGSRNRGL